ncbi:MAG: hypothetical protein J0L57_03235, partial [Burkholderiales bacterium]|nr:hypothetical protein [Burkholderiales bacterium]
SAGAAARAGAGRPNKPSSTRPSQRRRPAGQALGSAAAGPDDKLKRPGAGVESGRSIAGSGKPCTALSIGRPA